MSSLLLQLLCAISSLSLSAPQNDPPPNIVYIMSDELGYYELSCMGHENLQTPNIDQLAAEGTRFTQFLAGSPLCAPTRGVLMTGKHSGHTSVRTNGGGTPMRLEEETIATSLKRAGYATGGFGKWGCGGRGSSGVPEKHGFDEFFGYYDQVHAHTYFPPYLLRNSEEVPLKGNVGGESGETYAQYVIMDQAREFIRANHKQPFFCYLPVTPPHGLFNIPDSDPAWAIYKDKPWPEEARRYAALVTMLDRQVGELRELLTELGVADNTLIVFTGDNGGQDYFRDQEHPRGFHGPNVHPQTGVQFRGQKGKVYEGGLRIPAIFHMPGKIAAGRVSDHLSYFPDTFPTLAELAGAQTPDDLDGISMLPELFGADAIGRAQQQHEYLYWELGQQRAVRVKHWKAVRPKKNAEWELYDLRVDISEANDVAKDHEKQLELMKSFADAASTPAVIGDWGDRTLHEKDRKSKGVKRKAKAPANKKQPKLESKSSELQKHNLLIIHTDEHNFRTLGCYRDSLSEEQAFMWGKNAVVETPHIDRLAKEGVMCTSFYATSPVCSPSRASFVSGRYPQHTPVTTNNIALADDVVTFAEVLRRKGWVTGYTGKWHLDGGAKPGWTPERDFGFSDRRYMFNRGHWKKFAPTDAGAKVASVNEKGQFSYAVDNADEKSFATDFLTDRTIEFIEQNREQPFCYMLSLPDPHGPDTVRAPYNTMYIDQEFEQPRTFDVAAEASPQWAQPKGRFQNMAQYFGMVKCIDDNVGRILAALEKNGVLENTIVIFTSDHGDLRGEHHRQNKGVPYEASALVPFVIRAPKLVPAGAVVGQAMGTVDFMPTALKLMGVQAGETVQGRDLSTWLQKPPAPMQASVTFVRQAGKGKQGWLAAVTDRYKLVVSADDQPWLFDLQLDPDELRNYFETESHADVRTSLTRQLRGYATDFQDPYLEGVRWTGTGSPKPAK
jgi:arylsulfatase A-like enzyme